MGWTVEQNTGVNDYVIRCVWFKGYIYAGTRDDGVWRRDGIGPWVHVFNGPIAGGGVLWHWEEDDALYCGDSWNIYRSVDGVAWVLDQNLGALGSGQAAFHSWSEIGGYGSYLYVANHDNGPPQTYFYRRDLAGVWANYAAPHAGAEGAVGKGIIGFGGEVYWTNNTRVRYWDGAAWSAEATLDGLCGYASYMSIVDNKLYIGASVTLSPPGGYYWKTSAATNWSFLNHQVPDNTFGVFTLNDGADGETYTWSTDNGTDIRVYHKVNNHLNLIGQDTAAIIGIGGVRGGIGVDATGAMYLASRSAGTVRFFAFVGIYNLTPVGNGLYPQSMDCDGDGDALYVGLYDTTTAQPILISVPLPLDGATSTGSAMFQPGAGDAINVKCTDVGDNLVISGKFAANNENVETSDDAGLTWTDIDRDAWGADTAQPLVVAPLTMDEVMVALATAQDIVETLDAGATVWTVNNAAVGYSPGAMVLLPNGTEMLIGDDGANLINYSPNRGVSVGVVTGAFGGNVAALEIT